MKNRSMILMAILPVLACFAFLPGARAICNEGCGSNFNTFEGENALINDTTGAANTAFGWFALFTNLDGSFNTGLGAGALDFNNGSDNTAVGVAALLLNSTGLDNTAVGAAAMEFNDTANNGVAVGSFALNSNVSGDDNTAIGFEALEFNVSGVTNAALGTFAAQNTNAAFNTAIGGFALQANTAGTENTAVGAGAMESADGGSNNTAVGFLAGVSITGSGNTFIGSNAGTIPPAIGEYNNTILLGHLGDDDANTPDGRTYIANIIGVTPGSGGTQNVIIDEDGQLGSVVSARRFKKDIEPMDQISEAVLALKPVTFHYKSGDTKKAKETPQYGLIAEDVEQINRDLVIYDKAGQLLSVRYDAVNVMLLNEFLKEHKKVEEQQASISQLKNEMQTMVAQLKEQAAQIQKVSAQLQVAKPAAKVVVNKP